VAGTQRAPDGLERDPARLAAPVALERELQLACDADARKAEDMGSNLVHGAGGEIDQAIIGRPTL
jgi:hypothetical protein